MLSRLGPVGLSVLALAASFVIVVTAGGVLAAAGIGTADQAPTPAPTGTRAPPPAQPADVFPVDVADLAGGRTLEPVAGVTFYRGPAPDDAAAQMSDDSGRVLLCVRLSDAWSLPRPTLRHWTDHHGDRCRPVQPGITLQLPLERVR
jgi:hypothetical protein